MLALGLLCLLWGMLLLWWSLPLATLPRHGRWLPLAATLHITAAFVLLGKTI